MKHHLSSDGEAQEVLALRSGRDEYRFISSLGAETMLGDVQISEGRVSFTLEGRHYSYDMLPLADRIVLCDGDDYFELMRTDGSPQAERSSGEEQLTSRMPGKVLLHLVAPGEAVEKGRPLMILEAMKMEHEVSAPSSGSVEAFLFEPGQRVMPGDLLLRFSASE